MRKITAGSGRPLSAPRRAALTTSSPELSAVLSDLAAAAGVPPGDLAGLMRAKVEAIAALLAEGPENAAEGTSRAASARADDGLRHWLSSAGLRGKSLEAALVRARSKASR